MKKEYTLRIRICAEPDMDPDKAIQSFDKVRALAELLDVDISPISYYYEKSRKHYNYGEEVAGMQIHIYHKESFTGLKMLSDILEPFSLWVDLFPWSCEIVDPEA